MAEDLPIDAPNDEISVAPKEGEINFDYIKSRFFRVIHVDGITGGPRATGGAIQIAFFNERNAIPRRETFNIKQGRIGEIKGRRGRRAIVREVEVEAIMDLNTARALLEWLNKAVLTADIMEAQNQANQKSSES